MGEVNGYGTIEPMKRNWLEDRCPGTKASGTQGHGFEIWRSITETVSGEGISVWTQSSGSNKSKTS